MTDNGARNGHTSPRLAFCSRHRPDGMPHAKPPAPLLRRPARWISTTALARVHTHIHRDSGGEGCGAARHLRPMKTSHSLHEPVHRSSFPPPWRSERAPTRVPAALRAAPGRVRWPRSPGAVPSCHTHSPRRGWGAHTLRQLAAGKPLPDPTFLRALRCLEPLVALARRGRRAAPLTRASAPPRRRAAVARRRKGPQHLTRLQRLLTEPSSSLPTGEQCAVGGASAAHGAPSPPCCGGSDSVHHHNTVRSRTEAPPCWMTNHRPGKGSEVRARCPAEGSWD